MVICYSCPTFCILLIIELVPCGIVGMENVENRVLFSLLDSRQTNDTDGKEEHFEIAEAKLTVPNEEASLGTISKLSALSSQQEHVPAVVPMLNFDPNRLEKALRTKGSIDGTEEALYRSLLDHTIYEKDVRPCIHHSQPTNVTFGFLLNQIVEMDERNQALTTRSWLNINWMDPRLSWNETLWSDIKAIYIPHARIWKPDIILVNNAIREYYASLVSTDVMVTSDGNVTWLFSALFRSSCPIRVRYYPFDDQQCDLKFASWSHDITEINLGLNTDKGDLSSYMNNSEFDLVDMTAVREVVRFPSDTNSDWPTIVIRIHMHRRPLFYVFNHIVPCVLISSMAVLGFLMPPETGEKINMIITTLLSMGVYLQSITESIPPTSEGVPLIGMYYVSSLLMVCLATCVNVITLNMHRNGAANQGRHVPAWMQKWILGYLATFMRMSIREPDSIALLKASQSKKSTIRRSSILRDLKRVKNMSNVRAKSKEQNANRECECMDPLVHIYAESIMSSLVADSKPMNGSTIREDFASESTFLGRVVSDGIMPRISASSNSVLTEFETRFRRILKRVYRSLQQHEIREEILDERSRIQWQWQQLASVVDRLLLCLFCTATLFTIICLLIVPVAYRDNDSIMSILNFF
ncbi:CRE-LGC-4 protein [Caenorhabditis remanei]|uniref:Ligand-gated ion channel 4 n=1 Tax=Caenorhabditis remanei TaxID=31234 RepID=E3MAT8_CAERE|nr:CRE-LGC-4 protein [Caenorhabditis remanei]